MYYYPPTAEFKRKGKSRRASQKQRKAARDLGRKRKGKSRDQWKGLALAGAGAATVGALALRGRGIRSGDPSKGIGGTLKSAPKNIASGARGAAQRASSGARGAAQRASWGAQKAGYRATGAAQRVGAGAAGAARNVGAGAASVVPRGLIPERGSRNADPWANDDPWANPTSPAAPAGSAAPSDGRTRRKRGSGSTTPALPPSMMPRTKHGKPPNKPAWWGSSFSRAYRTANFSTTPDGRRVISLNIRRPIGSYYY